MSKAPARLLLLSLSTACSGAEPATPFPESFRYATELPGVVSTAGSGDWQSRTYRATASGNDCVEGELLSILTDADDASGVYLHYARDGVASLTGAVTVFDGPTQVVNGTVAISEWTAERVVVAVNDMELCDATQSCVPIESSGSIVVEGEPLELDGEVLPSTHLVDPSSGGPLCEFTYAP